MFYNRIVIRAEKDEFFFEKKQVATKRQEFGV